MKLETVREPRFEIVADWEKVAHAGASRGLELLRARVQEGGHVRTGEFLDSYEARVEGGRVLLGPTGERNQTIARVFASRGIDLVTLTDDEQALVGEAMDAELRRQLGSGEARAV